jgi:hypothetical protein
VRANPCCAAFEGRTRRERDAQLVGERACHGAERGFQRKSEQLGAGRDVRGDGKATQAAREHCGARAAQFRAARR